MNKVILFIAILVFFSSCKDDKKPARLIEKDVMINIMYDLSILQAIKYQSPASIDSFKINARDYVYKKYKVDSLQFAKSNVYYSTDSEEYKKMFTQVTKRISTQKATSDSLIKVESKIKVERPAGIKFQTRANCLK